MLFAFESFVYGIETLIDVLLAAVAVAVPAAVANELEALTTPSAPVVKYVSVLFVAALARDPHDPETCATPVRVSAVAETDTPVLIFAFAELFPISRLLTVKFARIVLAPVPEKFRLL